jgi:hypothetical protein
MADINQFNPQSFAGSQPGDGADGSVQQEFGRIGSDLIDALSNRAEAIVTEQKSRAASEIAALATMMRNAVQCVDQTNRGAISDYAADMAGEIDRFADRLRVSSWRVLTADVEDFARRWPALFMASSAVAGFVLGRILVSPQDSSTSASPPGMAEAAICTEGPATGGRLSEGGAARGFGRPAGEEAP